MMKVVMIDDDRIVREYIRIVLERTNGEFEMVGEASNGSKGLKLLEELKPDILILDMEMPSMDGIALLQELEKKNMAIRTLILSCHDEFDYVRQAMKLGAADYLLKHKIDDDAILDGLRMLRDKQMKPVHETGSGIHMPVSENELSMFLTGRLLEEEYKATAEKIASETDTVIVCAAEIDYLKAYVRLQGKPCGKELEKKVWDTFKHDFPSECRCFPCRMETGYYAFLFVFEGLSAAKQEFYIVITNYLERVAKSCNITITAGVSEVNPGVAQAQRQWEHAREALMNKLYYGNAGIIRYEELKECKEGNVLQTLLEGLRNQPMNRQEVLFAVNAMFENIEMTHIPFRRFQQFFYELLNALMQIVSRMNLEISDVFSQVDFVNEALETLEILDDFREWFQNAVNNIFDAAQRKTGGNIRKEIVRALSYIEEHYREDINLEDIAKHVCVSKTYFSSIFKKETGKNFSLYLLDFRLEKACELLRQSEEKIYNIAYDVGFQSHNYFNNIFKERYGMTPKEYRKHFR